MTDSAALELWSSLLPLWFIAALISALITGAMVAYAHRLAPMDRPGRHRSHAVVTPRGGGVAIVVACVAILLGVWAGTTQAQVARMAQVLLAAMLLVGGVGYLDDLRGLPVLPRLLVHLATAVAVAWALYGVGPVDAVQLLQAVLAVLIVVWSINLHNFMDGANGVLATQALFVFGAVTALAFRHDLFLSVFAGSLAAATAAFLPFNFPRARIFLGDVGSGALGLAIAVVLLVAVRVDCLDGWGGALLVSAFACDATLTLLSRMMRGRRWYTRHREHLYQWLVRSGWSHTGVTAVYAAWNLAVVLPAVLLSRSWTPGPRAALTVTVYGLAIGLWFYGKRRLLAAHREY